MEYITSSDFHFKNTAVALESLKEFTGDISF